LHNLALFWVKKRHFFLNFFGENILKIITSVPGLEIFYIVGVGFSGEEFADCLTETKKARPFQRKTKL
jgi:hypothetical protein